MAARAVLTYLATMLVRVAAHTITRQAQVGAVQVFDLDTRTPGRRNVLGLVTFLAGYPGMFSFEHKTRLIVIERFAARVPVNHIKIQSIVIGVAARALLARGIRSDEGGMQASLVDHAVADFRMAFQTFELRGASCQIVALRAVCRPTQGLMC